MSPTVADIIALYNALYPVIGGVFVTSLGLKIVAKIFARM